MRTQHPRPADWTCRYCGNDVPPAYAHKCLEYDKHLTDAATRDQIVRANDAVSVNLDDGLPRFQAAQGYACALTAVMLSDARIAEFRPSLRLRERVAKLVGNWDIGDEAIRVVCQGIASGMSAFGQDAEERLEAKPASPAREAGDAQ